MAMSEGLEKVCVRLLLATVEVIETSTKTGGSAEPLAPLLLSVLVHAKLGRSERERNCRGQDFPWAPAGQQRQLGVH